MPLQASRLLEAPPPLRRGRIKQAIWTTVFGEKSPLSFDEMCRIAAHLGITGIDLAEPDDWPVLRRHGLKPIMVDSYTISFEDGIIHPEGHVRIERDIRPWIDRCAENGVRNLVILGGEKRGMEPDRAMDNAAAFMKRIIAQLEDRQVIGSIENINDRNSQPGFGRRDQIFGHFQWGVDLCRRVDSPSFRIICDLYHLQLEDGNLERTIRENIDLITEFHVAGVPARHEIDQTQEVNFGYIAGVIASTGFDGYVSHEWRPTPGREPIESLNQAITIMDA